MKAKTSPIATPCALAQPDGEIELRALRHDDARTVATAICRREQKDSTYLIGHCFESVRAVARYFSILSTTSGIRRGHVVRLDRVVRQVVELERRILLQSHRLPPSHAHRLLESALVELPIDEVVRRLLLAAQRPRHRHARRAPPASSRLRSRPASAGCPSAPTRDRSRVPAGIVPSQRAIIGTRMPPS